MFVKLKQNNSVYKTIIEKNVLYLYQKTAILELEINLTANLNW